MKTDCTRYVTKVSRLKLYLQMLYTSEGRDNNTSVYKNITSCLFTKGSKCCKWEKEADKETKTDKGFYHCTINS